MPAPADITLSNISVTEQAATGSVIGTLGAVDPITRVGTELAVNTSTAGEQRLPTVATLSDGRFVVVWWDVVGTGNIRGRVMNADGTASTESDFAINTNAGGFSPTVAALQDGRFVVTWSEYNGPAPDQSGSQVRGRVMNPDGTGTSGDFIINTTTPEGQSSSTVAALADGRFVVTWIDFSGTPPDTSGPQIRGRVMNLDGTGSADDFIINTTTTNPQWSPIVATLDDGRFVVTWWDLSSGIQIRGRVMNADGTPSTANDFLIDTTTANSQVPTVAALPDGRFVVTWISYSGAAPDTSGAQIRGRVMNADGTGTTDDFIINTTTAGHQQYPSVAGLPDGRFVVTWQDASLAAPDGSGTQIRGRVMNADGTASTDSDFIINTSTSGDQLSPTVAALPDGRFVVTWQDFSGTGSDTSGSSIRAQIFELAPNPTAPVIASGGGGALLEVSLTENSAIVTQLAAADTDEPAQSLIWSILAPYGSNGAGADASKFTIDATTGVLSFLTGPNFDAPTDANADNVYNVTVRVSDGFGGTDTQTITVTVTNLLGVAPPPSDDAIITGTEEPDILAGLGGNNQILGLADPDQLSGNGGNDTLDGGTGTDTMTGGQGDDTYYVDVYQDLIVEAAVGGTDMVISSVSYDLSPNIENLTLVGPNAISVVANDLNNYLVGTQFNNTFDGRAGADTMVGGAGFDVYYVDTYLDVIIEDGGDFDIVISSAHYIGHANIEYIELSGAADIDAIGNQLDNTMLGNLGNNGLAGGEGNDTLYGQDGADRLDGEQGADQMFGGLGADTYYVDHVDDMVYEDDTGATDYDAVWSVLATYTLPDNVEIFIAAGTADVGGTGNDLSTLMLGNEGANTLNSLGGSDIVLGREGNDTINGGAGGDGIGFGYDVISGGQGADLMTGGGGHDYFSYESITHADDTITDFATQAGADDDILDFRPMFFPTFTNTAGVTNVAQAVSSGHLTYTQSGADVLVYADADGGGTENVLMATILNQTAANVQTYTLI